MKSSPSHEDKLVHSWLEIQCFFSTAPKLFHFYWVHSPISSVPTSSVPLTILANPFHHCFSVCTVSCFHCCSVLHFHVFTVLIKHNIFDKKKNESFFICYSSKAIMNRWYPCMSVHWICHDGVCLVLDKLFCSQSFWSDIGSHINLGAKLSQCVLLMPCIKQLFSILLSSSVFQGLHIPPPQPLVCQSGFPIALCYIQ